MKIIEQIEIKNFRSFGNRKGETTKVSKISPLNIISGANDSGKSNILRGLNLFFNGYTELNEFYDFQRDYFKKDNTDERDIKEELTTIKIWFHNEKNRGKNSSAQGRVFLPERFWVSKKWKKSTEFSQSDLLSNIHLSFKHEKGDFYQNFLSEDGESMKSMTNASLQKQLTDFLGSIQYHYIPAIKDRLYFSHLYGELQQTLWKATNSSVDIKKIEFEEEIQKETTLLMDEFKQTLNHPTLNFDPAFQLPQNMIDLFKTLQVKTGDIDLRFRGDGVQAKLIPEILNYIAIREKSLTTKTVRQGEQSKKYFLWGFEEPENSYEYRNAQLLADRFSNKFIEHAQIFITTHSFNFISMTGEHISRYRVWKDISSLNSKISKLKVENSGKLGLEGAKEDEDVLLEELGFFHLNEEISKAYNSVEEMKSKYQERLGHITKPVIYTEGNNTQYLSTSKELYSDDIDYDIESLGGKNEIKKFFTMFSTANFTRFKIIFIFDCDAENEYNYCKLRETEYLVPYILPKNTNNSLEETSKGIENMFDDILFDNETLAFSITETNKDGNIISRKRTLRKPEFSLFINEENADENAFYMFEQVQIFIREKFS